MWECVQPCPCAWHLSAQQDGGQYGAGAPGAGGGDREDVQAGVLAQHRVLLLGEEVVVEHKLSCVRDHEILE